MGPPDPDTPEALIICEGIETGLSLMGGMMGKPVEVWAALSTSGMVAVDLPPVPDVLTIATDNDSNNAGRIAGDKLADRAISSGWRVEMLHAPEGQDWNDVLMQQGGRT